MNIFFNNLVVGAEEYNKHYIEEFTKIKDGDTVIARINLGYGISLTKEIRFADFDAWEISHKREVSNDKIIITAAEIVKGQKAKDDLTKIIEENKDKFYLKINIVDQKPKYELEKYGRILGKIYFIDKFGKEQYLSQVMKDLGHERSN